MGSDDSAFVYNKEKSCGTVVAQVLFSNVGMFLLVAGYAAFGAWAFIQFEGGAEELRYADKRTAAEGVEDALEYTVNLLWYYGDEKLNWTYEAYEEKVLDKLLDLESFVMDAVTDHRYDGTIDNWDYDWTFSKSILLTMTVMSTIGYGHITPKTFEGQMFCIFYSLIGCGLFLVFLANLGDVMAKGFIYFYSRMCCRWFRARRYISEVPEGESECSALHVMDDNVGTEEYMPTSSLFVPITLNIFVLHIYMLAGGVLFSTWEGWPLTASFYFTFITLSTVGYGDLVPGNSLLDGNSLGGQLKMFTCLSYIVLGMVLLSMSISLMQAQIIEKCKYVAKEIGLTKDNSVEEATRKSSLDSQTSNAPPIIRGSSPYRRPSASRGGADAGEWLGIPGAYQNGNL